MGRTWEPWHPAPVPKLRGTGGTLRVDEKSRRDQDHPPGGFGTPRPGRTEYALSAVPTGLGWDSWVTSPGAEAPGYFRASLREVGMHPSQVLKCGGPGNPGIPPRSPGARDRGTLRVDEKSRRDQDHPPGRLRLGESRSALAGPRTNFYWRIQATNPPRGAI